MTTEEFRNLLAKTEYYDSLKKEEVQLKIPHINLDEKIKLIDFHRWLSDQISSWKKFTEENPSNRLRGHFEVFQKSRNLLEQIINKNHPSESKGLIQNAVGLINQHKSILSFNAPETNFLIKLEKIDPAKLDGATKFITGEVNVNQLNQKDYLLGVLLASRFQEDDKLDQLSRSDSELESLRRLRAKQTKFLDDSEQSIADYLNEVENNFKTHVENIDKFKEDKEKLFEGWYSTAKQEYTDFKNKSEKEILNLEKTYQELLRLKKPAEYWNKRASALNKEGWRAIRVLIGLVILSCVVLYLLLWKTPEGMLLSFSKNTATAIKWSVIYVTFISFLAFGIRAVYKLVFSSFHLARDAEEREQLTYVYLSLINESAIDDKDKHLILQSLFSRAETGLLKNDSSPSMPNDLHSKFFSINPNS